jgi:hypothetical protein
MFCERILYSDHVISQMFRREITLSEVKMILDEGEIIREYPEDTPYPSFLVLGFANLRPLHLLVAKDDAGICILVTVYEPDKNVWSADFKIKIR